jgi:RNA polymerase sigma-70 factor (ECF subfamily)
MTDVAAMFARFLPVLRVRALQFRLDPRCRALLDGSDLVQEACLKAVANLDRFRGTTEGEMVVWLTEILKTAAIDLFRREHARKRKPPDDLAAVVADVADQSSRRFERVAASSADSPSRVADRREGLVRLAAAIERLPVRQREVFVAHFLLDQTVAEIAEQRGETPKAVAGRILRGMKRVRELLRMGQGNADT